MINKFEKLFYKVDTPHDLFLPKEEFVLQKNWIVCSILEDCNNLKVFDEEDYIDKCASFYKNSNNIFYTLLFSFDNKDIVESTIDLKEHDYLIKLENAINPSLYTEHYYESFAITNDKQEFLILHSHAENISFICGDEKFLKFQFDTENIIQFMDIYYKNILNFGNFCKPFPWKKYGIKSNNFLPHSIAIDSDKL